MKTRNFFLALALVAATSFAYVEVTQAQVSGSIERVWIEHNILQNGEKGMRIHLEFTAANMSGATGKVAAYFFFSDGTPLRDFNDQYRTTGGDVSVGRDFTPSYGSSHFSDFTLFMPYDELHMTDGEHRLKFHIILWHQLSGEWMSFARSEDNYFEYWSGDIDWDYETTSDGEVSLRAGFTPDPYTVEMQAVGRIHASQAKEGCAGYVTPVPDFRIHWHGNSSMLRVYFESDGGEDTVLLINDPSRDWHCNDDFADVSLDPLLTFRSPEEGQYDIWVGTYSDDDEVSGTLYITELDLHP